MTLAYTEIKRIMIALSIGPEMPTWSIILCKHVRFRVCLVYDTQHSKHQLSWNIHDISKLLRTRMNVVAYNFNLTLVRLTLFGINWLGLNKTGQVVSFHSGWTLNVNAPISCLMPRGSARTVTSVPPLKLLEALVVPVQSNLSLRITFGGRAVA